MIGSARIGFGGPLTEAERAKHEADVRRARIDVARRTAAWTEIPDDLVRRGPFLVSASTDHVYQPCRGVVFASSSASPIAEYSALYFYERDGELVFLERLRGTWSERVDRQARREARRRQAAS